MLKLQSLMKASYFRNRSTYLDLIQNIQLKYWCIFPRIELTREYLANLIEPLIAEAYGIQNFDVHGKVNLK